MTDRLSRRALLRGAGLAGAAGLAGCQRLAAVFPESKRRNTPQSTDDSVTGTVTDPDGAPIADASVVALDGTAAEIAATTTGADGGFSLSVSRPVWLRARRSGFTERTLAAEPGRSVDVVLMPDDGTAALTFGGDVMFGRRFYSPATDRLAPHHRIRPEQRRRDHERVLAPVEPLLQSADITSVNLESPLTTSPVRHPEKTYSFISHPVAGEVLAEAGVDYAALGNNHAFDALTPGLEATTERLDEAGIRHSGAGLTTQRAWEPATMEAAGLTVAMVSCCDIVGSDLYDLHWSADDGANRPTTVSADGESVTVPEGAGVAEAGVDSVASRVAAATDTADVVVVQIHGGVQYRRRPTDRMAALTDAAVAAGADLVVNHHPHVVGGIERRDGAVVAWTLGNFVFDQTVWETFPSYLLTAYVTAEGAARVVADPLLLDGFVPHGVVGKPNRVLRHRTAARSGAEARATDTGVALGRGTAAPAKQTATLDRTGLYERREGWVTDIAEGDATLGRALFPTGSFESTDIDDTGYDGTLWRFNRTPPDAGGRSASTAAAASASSASTAIRRTFCSRTGAGFRYQGR